MRNLGGALVILALVGCTRATPTPTPTVTEPTSETEPALRLHAVVRLAQSGLESRTTFRCRLERVADGWRVSEIREQVALRDGEREASKSVTRAAFDAASPLAALGLPPTLLRLAGHRGLERDLVIRIGGLAVPMRQVRFGTPDRGEATTTGRGRFGPIELALSARSSWEGAVPGRLPRRLTVTYTTTAKDGPGRDATSTVSLELRIDPEVRS